MISNIEDKAGNGHPELAKALSRAIPDPAATLQICAFITRKWPGRAQNLGSTHDGVHFYCSERIF